ncbi:MAG: hypothetical protein Kow0089_16450 [Desulfobulbaceae bacterium]
MMSRMNCWEFFDCGREPGGNNVREMGVCPAAAATELDGINDGRNGGRSCWAIAGTLCEGEVQGSYAQKLGNCLKCDFHAFVFGQQKDRYISTKKILDVLGGKITATCVTSEVEQGLRNVI